MACCTRCSRLCPWQWAGTDLGWFPALLEGLLGRLGCLELRLLQDLPGLRPGVLLVCLQEAIRVRDQA